MGEACLCFMVWAAHILKYMFRRNEHRMLTNKSKLNYFKSYKTESMPRNVLHSCLSGSLHYLASLEACIRTWEGAGRGGPSFRAHCSPVRYNHKPRSPLPEPLMTTCCCCHCRYAVVTLCLHTPR